MINIHLVNDEKFIRQSLERFENNFPKKNVFLVNDFGCKKKGFLENEARLVFFNFNENDVKEEILKLTKDENQINLFVHYLDFPKSELIKFLRKRITFKTYWIFYGNDLYKLIYRNGNYELFDRNLEKGYFKREIKRNLRRLYTKIVGRKEYNSVANFIEHLDYFCFWNKNDYNLLKSNFQTSAVYRNFRYDSVKFDSSNIIENHKDAYVVMVNHSSSASGNHLHVLNKLNNSEIKKKISSLIVPLNYGKKELARQINEFCKSNFEPTYSPLLNFLPKEEYFMLLDSVDIAIFGHRRQEAGNNINFLLGKGVKVFLRRDNNLLEFYKKLGVEIFCLEDDFKNVDDLVPMNLASMNKNRELILDYFSEDKINEWHLKLI